MDVEPLWGPPLGLSFTGWSRDPTVAPGRVWDSEVTRPVGWQDMVSEWCSAALCWQGVPVGPGPAGMVVVGSNSS